MNNSRKNVFMLTLSVTLCFFFLFLTPTHAQKNPKPELTAKPNPKPKSNSTSSNIKPNATSPYHFANHFCLSRRLDVKSTFCLQVLRSSPTSTKAKDNQALLDIAADLAIKFGNKTLLFLQNLSKDKTTMSNLKPVIDECLSAYEGYVVQYNMLVQESKTEAQLASYDAELAKLEIKRCVNALSGTKNADIEAQNKIALDFTKLTQNIADSID